MKKKINRILITFIIFIICVNIFYNPIPIFKNNKINNDIEKETISTDNIKSEEIIEEYLTEDILILSEKYLDLLNIIKSNNIKMPIIENMVPQGIAIIKNYIFITYYSNIKGNNSICYIMNKKGEFIKKVQLDTNSHVGGIGYDEQNEYIYIPDNNGIINIYPLEDFLLQAEVKAIQKFDNIGDNLPYYKNNKKNQIDYLYIDNNMLYIGNFSRNNQGMIKKYEIKNNEGLIELSLKKSFLVPNEIQGVVIKKIKDKEYIIMSQSYGRNKPSYLNIYEYDENIDDYRINNIKKQTYKLPPMLEQIYPTNNSLYIIFESSASLYYNCLEKVNSICILDLEKILSEFYNM